MPHSVLLSKLPACVIKGVKLAWFTNYLVRNSKWLFKTSNLRVNLLVVECPKDLFSDLMFMFADDTVVFSAGKPAEEIESVLNSELENIFRYFIKNNLIVNLRWGKISNVIWHQKKT